ncbi:MAG: hypothetical protein V7752_11720 [Halopseudomonas sp.]
MIRHPSFLLLALMALICSGQGQAEQRASVLVIESYHASYQWDADYRRGINDILGDSAELHFFQMDTKRLPTSEHPLRADLAWQAYRDTQPDLVILGDDNALKHLGRRLADTDTPVIYLGVNNNPRNYFSKIPRNITGVLERPLLNRSIIYMREVMEGTLNKVLILFDDGTTAQALLEEQFQGKQQRTVGPVDVHIRLIGNIDDWREAVVSAEALEYDAIVVGLYHTLTEKNGAHVPAQEVITWSSSHTKVPLFAFWEFAVGHDMAIGGLVLDGYTQGKVAATIAADVLAGAPLPRLPQSSDEGQFVFSQTQLDKWGITLPAGFSEISTLLP